MANRWYVFKDKKELGPFDAKELRHRLHTGEVDPFDLVGKDGAAIMIKQPLVEVDEIFQVAANETPLEQTSESSELAESVVSPESSKQTILQPEKPKKTEEIKLAGPVPGQATPKQDKPIQDKPKQGEPKKSCEQVKPEKNEDSPPRTLKLVSLKDKNKVVDAHAAEQDAIKVKRNRGRKFFVINANRREAGPFSAEEVISLFEKKSIDRDVKVRKRNASALVSIEKFVAVYSVSHKKGGKAEAPERTRINPKAIIQNSLFAVKIAVKEKKSTQAILSIAAFILVLVVGGIGLWSLNMLPFKQSHKSQVSSPSPDIDESEKPIVRKQKPIEAKAAPTGQPQQAQKLALAAKQLPLPLPSKTPLKSADTPTKPQKDTKNALSQAKSKQTKPPAKKENLAKKPVKPVAISKPQTALPTPISSPAQIAAVTPKASVAPTAAKTTEKEPPAAKPLQKEATEPPKPPTKVASATPPKDSGNVTLTGVTFDKSQLFNCAMKCTIVVKDGSGSKYVVTFFTGAFMEQLRAKAGPFTFQGFMGTQGSGKVLVLKQVL